MCTECPFASSEHGPGPWAGNVKNVKNIPACWKSCDVLTRIYIRENSSNSINVVQATTIALYELCSESKNK